MSSFCSNTPKEIYMPLKQQIFEKRMRFLAAAMCLLLCACTQLAEQLTTPNEQEIETCAKLSEITIGMTTSQVLSSCERKPLRTSNIITGGGKQVEIWVYKGSYLHFVGGKVESIYQ
jgi:hypothetical protein